MSRRDAQMEKVKAMLDEWNAEIDKLEAKARAADAEAKIRYEEQLAQLRQKREELKKLADDMKEAGGDAWEDLKVGLENTWDIFKSSLGRAKSEFEQGYKKGRDGDLSTDNSGVKEQSDGPPDVKR